MRVFLFVVFLFHGLIHFLGFVKGFRLAEIDQLTQPISREVGLVWLVAGILFLGVMILLLVKKNWAWMPAVLAVVISQVLIFFSWEDAKFGTIANIITAFFVLFSYAKWGFHKQIGNETRLLLENNVDEKSIVTEEMVETLPDSVGKWLRNIGVVGKEVIHTVNLKQKGLMKLKPEQKDWYTADAVQLVTTGKPGFLWKVNMKMMPFVDVIGRDKFFEGKASMVIKIGSLIPVVNASNTKKLNQSTLQRYLLELPWYPTAALSSYIKWEEVGPNAARATLSFKGVEGSAVYTFNEAGDLLRVSAMRYKEDTPTSQLAESIGEVLECTKVEGITIPTKMNVSWVEANGLFTWFKINVYDVEFNKGPGRQLS